MSALSDQAILEMVEVLQSAEQKRKVDELLDTLLAIALTRDRSKKDLAAGAQAVIVHSAAIAILGAKELPLPIRYWLGGHLLNVHKEGMASTLFKKPRGRPRETSRHGHIHARIDELRAQGVKLGAVQKPGETGAFEQAAEEFDLNTEYVEKIYYQFARERLIERVEKELRQIQAKEMDLNLAIGRGDLDAEEASDLLEDDLARLTALLKEAFPTLEP